LIHAARSQIQSIKLKKLYRCVVVHDERDRNTLCRAVGFYEYLLSGDCHLNVVHHKGDVRDSLDQFWQRTVRIKLHPFNTIGALDVPGCIELVRFAVVFGRQRPDRWNANMMVTEFRHNETQDQ